MGWETSNRRSRLPADWSVIRQRVLRRDSYRCQAPLEGGYICGAPANQVDHVERGDNHAPSNLQALCAFHHSRKTAREAAEARRRVPRPKRARTPEAHPGALP